MLQLGEHEVSAESADRPDVGHGSSSDTSWRRRRRKARSRSF